MVNRRQILTGAALLTASPFIRAAQFPQRPVTLIIPFPPGGGTDIHLRKFAQLCEPYLGQSMVVENRPGASGTVALTTLARNTRPDGYTVSVFVPTSLRLPLLQQMNYDPLKDFTYVSRLSGYTYVIAVRNDSSLRTWRDLVAYARANPGKLSVGNAGFYSTTHIGLERIMQVEGISLNAIPYKGDGDQVQDLLGGQLDVGTPSMSIAPHVEGGRLRMLAVWTERRIDRFPDVPTLTQAGTNSVLETPYGLVGPAGMDPAITQTLAEVFRQASATAENQKLLAQLGQLNLYAGPQEYRAWVERTYAQEKVLFQNLNASKPQGT